MIKSLANGKSHQPINNMLTSLADIYIYLCKTFQQQQHQSSCKQHAKIHTANKQLIESFTRNYILYNMECVVNKMIKSSLQIVNTCEDIFKQ